MEFIEVLKWIMLIILGITFVLSLLFVARKPHVFTSDKNKNKNQTNTKD